MQNDDHRNDRYGRRDSWQSDRDEELRASRGYGRSDRDQPGIVSDRDWAGPSEYGRGGDYGPGNGDQSRNYRRDSEDMYRGSASTYSGRDYGRDMSSGRGYTGSGYGNEGYGGSYASRGYGSGQRGQDMGRDYGSTGYAGDNYGGRNQGSGDWDRGMSSSMGAGRMGYAASGAAMGSGRGSDFGRSSSWDDDYGQGPMGYGSGSTGRGQSSYGTASGSRYGSYSQNESYSTQGGQHRGRGPKGYARSDERVREDVSDRLSDDHMIDASDIEVQVSGGEVTLTGTVDSRDTKRRAEDCAECVSGVQHVQNNLRVKRDGASGSASQSGTTASGSSMGGASGSSSTGSASGAGAAGAGSSGTSGISSAGTGSASGSTTSRS